ncbi:MAG: nucleotide exchange factor GrpE [Clostridia bacterium]|nr:nucleotide exchange factor GrpE [Clostridia bacterium]
MNKEDVNPNTEENEAVKASEEEEEKAPKKAEKQDKKQVLKAEIDRLEKENKKLSEDNAEQNDKYMRLAAEYDNYRKRSTKEREGVYTEAFADAAAAFLPLIDNIERAVSFAEDNSNLSEGVKMLYKQLGDILTKLKIEEISPDGEQFDPTYHNAIMHDEDENYGENVVSQTLQKGYRIGEKVIRHALVKVVN